MNKYIKISILVFIILTFIFGAFVYNGYFVSFAVGSSMAPTIPADTPTVLIHSEVDSVEQVDKGDIVLYRDAYFNSNINHRIISINYSDSRVTIDGDNKSQSIRQTLSFTEFNKSVRGKVEYIFIL